MNIAMKVFESREFEQFVSCFAIAHELKNFGTFGLASQFYVVKNGDNRSFATG